MLFFLFLLASDVPHTILPESIDLKLKPEMQQTPLSSVVKDDATFSESDQERKKRQQSNYNFPDSVIFYGGSTEYIPPTSPRPSHHHHSQGDCCDCKKCCDDQGLCCQPCVHLEDACSKILHYLCCLCSGCECPDCCSGGDGG